MLAYCARLCVIVLLLIVVTQVEAQVKSRTTASTTAKPMHQGEHKLIPDDHRTTTKSTTSHTPTVTPVGRSVPILGGTKTTSIPTTAKATTTKSPKKVTVPTTTTILTTETPTIPTTEIPVTEPTTIPITALPPLEPEFVEKPEELRGRAVPIPASSVSVGFPDPFSISHEWALFNGRMDNLTFILLELMKPVYSVFTNSNEEFKRNRTGFLASFKTNFNEKHLKKIVELLRPVDDELRRNKAFTAINPAIDLPTIVDAIKFAKTNPTEVNDRGRLKWMEVNSMAATIHYIYKRLMPTFQDVGLEEINRTMGIHYPSWVTDFVSRDHENTFQLMAARNLTAYIHEQMNILGEKDHLIRILERLLNHTVLSKWDPSKTSWNMYCYGNNHGGQIHTKFDVLLDAALYLCLADMKFAVLEMTNNVYMAWAAENENGDKRDLEGTRTEIETTLKARLERKYRIAAHLGNQNIETPIAPKRFKCDLPPKECGEAPYATAPTCPPGVYIREGAVYHNGKKLELPTHPNESVVADGKAIECIGLELIPYNKNGTVTPCFLKDGKCIDHVTGVVMDDLRVVLTPVLLDENRVPVYRDSWTPSYPKSSEWGIMDCGIHPDLPVPPDPPQGDCKNQTDKNQTEIKCGYEDLRKPNMTQSAQFSNAFPGYLESELVLNPDGKCIGTCRNYRQPTTTCVNKTSHCELYRQSHCEDSASQCMQLSKCPNKVRRCIRTSREVNFCPAKEGSGRAYDWLKFNDKIRWGGIVDTVNNTPVTDESKEQCNGNKIMKLRERWEMESGLILVTPEYCEICLCVCDDPLTEEGRHYFDISPRVANTGSGFVVTGLRFEQRNNTMSLNIQQGKLSEDGSIDVGTVSWLEPNPTPDRVPLGNSGFLRINLDEVSSRFTEVVTGIRWRQNGHALSLEAGFTEFILQPPSASSKVNFISTQSQSESIRQRFDLSEVISPFNQAGPSQPYPITDESKYYIEFDASSLEIDAGQSVVPFFDLQPILSSDTLPVPLSAVGILYKSKTGSGGFLAPTVRTFVHPYIREQF